MTYKYQEILDQLDRDGKLEFANEQEVRLAMLKLCNLVTHLFDNQANEILKSAKNIDNVTDKEVTQLNNKLFEINNYRNPNYNAIKALKISVRKPLQEPEDFDLLFALDYCIEYCILAESTISDKQIIKILNEIK